LYFDVALATSSTGKRTFSVRRQSTKTKAQSSFFYQIYSANGYQCDGEGKCENGILLRNLPNLQTLDFSGNRTLPLTASIS